MGSLTANSTTGSIFAAHPHQISPVLQVISRTISIFLIKQTGLMRHDVKNRCDYTYSALWFGG